MCLFLFAILSIIKYIMICICFQIDLLIIIKLPYLPLVIFFTLKLTVCDINIATQAVFLTVLIWYTFSHSFTFNIFVSI